MSLLTGPEIEAQVASGAIYVDPFIPDNVGPNSLDLRLYPELKVYTLPEGHLDADASNPTRVIEMDADGSYLLQPGLLYLGRTVETIGSERYVPIVEGRSSLGRLGCQVHMTAGVGDLGFRGTITLEIAVLHPLKLRPMTRICQALWVSVQGTPRLYQGRYQGQVAPTASRFHLSGYLPKGHS